MPGLWWLHGHDNRAHFLDEDLMPPGDFCPECGLLTNREYAPATLPDFRAFGRDITSTYDNRPIFSARLAQSFRAEFPGECDFLDLAVGRGEVVHVPVECAVATVYQSRSVLRRGELCETCVQFEYEMMPSPLWILGSSLPPERSIFQTDLQFGDRLAKSPFLLVRDAARRKIDAAGFKGLEWGEARIWPDDREVQES